MCIRDSNKIGNQIRIKFKKYIKTGIYEEWKKRNSGNSIEKIKEIIGLEEDYTEYLPCLLYTSRCV